MPRLSNDRILDDMDLQRLMDIEGMVAVPDSGYLSHERENACPVIYVSAMREERSGYDIVTSG